MARSGRISKAFTLVELLVVIGIIAVLVAILLPALNGARAAGNMVKCQSNMRQLVQAVQMFANEHKGHIPHHYINGASKIVGYTQLSGERWEFDSNAWGWEHTVMKYAKGDRNIFRCPADTYTDRTRFTSNDATAVPGKNDNVAFSYRINFSNEIVTADPLHAADPAYATFTSPKLTDLRPSARSIIFCEGVAWNTDQVINVDGRDDLEFVDVKSHDGRYNIYIDNPWNVAFRRHVQKTVAGDAMAASSRQKGTSNYAFADGHVQSMTFNETWQGYDTSALRGSMWQVTGFAPGWNHQPSQ